MNKKDKKIKNTKGKFRIPKPLFFGILVFLLLISIIAGGTLLSIRPISGDSQRRAFTVELGESTETVAHNLREEGLIRNEILFTLFSRIFDKSITAGTHYLSASQSMTEIMNNLGETVSADELTIQIPPAVDLLTLRQTFAKLGFPADEIDAAFAKEYDSPLLADRPTGASLEGYIFPDTYTIYKTDDLSVLIQQALDHFYAQLEQDGSLTLIQSSGRSIYETLTMASIVQKEASDPESQKMIAGVFDNRLAIGMKLGSDVTYQYAFRNGLCSENTPDGCDSPYNTRKYEGLPPGPVSNVLYATVQAVLNPTTNDYYFFVAGEDGNIYYSKTEAEHHENTRAHCGQLCYN